MEKKFRVLRIIGTAYKILAWIVLVVGVIFSIGMLLTSILGGGMLSQFGQEYSEIAGVAWAFSVAGGIVAFIVFLVVTVVCFLLLYAIGEYIYLMIAIEENTRLTAQRIGYSPPLPAPQF